MDELRYVPRERVHQVDKDVRELFELRDEVVALEARLRDLQAKELHGSQKLMNTAPSRTENGRFLPSAALAYAVIAAAGESRLDESPSDEDEASVHEARVADIAEEVCRILSETLDRTLYVEANIAAARGASSVDVAEGGRFTHRIAATLVDSLTLNVYEAGTVLSALYDELYDTLVGAPIRYRWGILQAGIEAITLATAPAPVRKQRQTPASMFYRDLSDL